MRHCEPDTREAARLGLANATFESHNLAEPGQGRTTYDVITVFDAIHDQAQPARVLENIYRALRPGGVLLMADIKASSRLEDNVDVPMSTYLYTTSLMHCMTVSLALDGAGLGAAWGPSWPRRCWPTPGSTTCGWPRSSRTRSTTTTSPEK